MDQGLPRPPPGQSRRRPPHPPRPHHRNRHRVLALPPRPPTAPTTSPEADYLTPDPTTRTPLSPLRLALRAHLRDDNGDHARHRYDKIQQHNNTTAGGATSTWADSSERRNTTLIWRL